MSGHAPPCPHSCFNHSLPLLCSPSVAASLAPPLPLGSRNRSLMILRTLLFLSFFPHLSRRWASFVKFKSSRHRPTPFIAVRTFKADWIATRATGLPPWIRDGLHQCEQDTWILQQCGGEVLVILALSLLENDFD